MSVTPSAYYPAVAVVQQVYLTRLTLVEVYPAFHWDTLVSHVPQIVNDALVALDNALLASHPGIVAYSGKAMVRDQILSVYHTYFNKTSEAGRVVVGLSIERSDISVTVRGDVVSEETGSIFFELVKQSCVGNDAKILELVKNAANQLASQSGIVAQAIINL